MSHPSGRQKGREWLKNRIMDYVTPLLRQYLDERDWSELVEMIEVAERSAQLGGPSTTHDTSAAKLSRVFTILGKITSRTAMRFAQSDEQSTSAHPSRTQRATVWLQTQVLDHVMPLLREHLQDRDWIELVEVLSVVNASEEAEPEGPSAADDKSTGKLRRVYSILSSLTSYSVWLSPLAASRSVNDPPAAVPISEATSDLEWPPLLLQQYGQGQSVPIHQWTAPHARKKPTVPYMKVTDLFGLVEHTIVIRREYDMAWTKIKSDLASPIPKHHRRGLCLWGNNGSGKSMCLRYLLIRCINEGYAVLWLASGELDSLLFDEGKVRAVGPKFFDVGLKDKGKQLIVLYDSMGKAEIIPKVYSAQKPPYIVYASSPQRSRYKEWAKRMGPSFLVFRSITRTEAACIFAVCPQIFVKGEGMYDAMAVFDNLGPSLHRITTKEVVDTGDIFNDFLEVSQHLVAVIRDIPPEDWRIDQIASAPDEFGVPSLQCDAYHQLFVLEPKYPHSPKAFNVEPGYTVKFATLFLARLFHTAFEKRNKTLKTFSMPVHCCCSWPLSESSHSCT